MVTANRGKTYAQRRKEADAKAVKLVSALRSSGKTVSKVNNESIASFEKRMAEQKVQELQLQQIQQAQAKQQAQAEQQAKAEQVKIETSKQKVIARNSIIEKSKERMLNPNASYDYFTPKSQTSSLKKSDSTVNIPKTPKIPAIDNFIFGASKKIEEWDAGTQKTIVNIENFYKKSPLLGKLYSGDSYVSKLALKTITAVPSGIVGTVGAGVSAVGKIGVSTVALVSGRGKQVKAEFLRAGKKTPSVIQKQFVTIDNGKVSFTPSQVVAIGSVVAGTVIGGAIRTKIKGGQVKTNAIKTTSQVSKNVKGSIQGTTKGYFSNVKGQKFTYKTVTKIPKKTLSTSSNGVKTYSQSPGKYKTTIYDSTGKAVNTKTGTIKPVIIKENIGTGSFFEKTKIKPTKSISKTLTDKGTRDVISSKTIGKKTYTTSFVDKKTFFGSSKIQTMGLRKTVTKGKITTTTVFPKTNILKFKPFNNAFNKRVNIASLKMFKNKKGSLSGFSTGSNVRSFNTDFNFVKGFGSGTDFMSKGKTSSNFVKSVPSRVTQVSKVVLTSSKNVQTFVPYLKTPSGVSNKLKTPSSVLSKSRISSPSRTILSNIFTSKNVSKPIGDTDPVFLPRPTIEPVTEPITEPIARTRSSSRIIYEPTPTPTPTTPTPVVSSSFSFSPIIPIIPLKRSVGSLGNSFNFKFKTKNKRVKSFKPTIRGSAFGIKGKTRKGAELTGLGERFTKKRF